MRQILKWLKDILVLDRRRVAYQSSILSPESRMLCRHDRSDEPRFIICRLRGLGPMALSHDGYPLV